MKKCTEVSLETSLYPGENRTLTLRRTNSFRFLNKVSEMPRCYLCGKDRPYETEDFKMLREYAKTHGTFWYFCSWKCLIKFARQRINHGNG